MSSYLKKKGHIYAYRRRKTAKQCIEKLNKIVQESSKKDVERLMDKVNNLWLAMDEKVGVFDGIPKRGEVWETPFDKKIKEGIVKFVDPVARYICPACGKPGYLFSPNLDLKGREFNRYILHISFEEETVTVCQISPLKTNLILISSVPSEGFFAMH